jgi:hypothetical protein
MTSTAVGALRTQLLLNVNRGTNAGQVINWSYWPRATRSRPWAGLDVAAELPSDDRVNASFEGRRRCAFSLYRRENISARSRRLLRRTTPYTLCNEPKEQEVPALHAREQACSVTCIEDKRNRRLRSYITRL